MAGRRYSDAEIARKLSAAARFEAGRSHKEVAALLGISERTYRRWRRRFPASTAAESRTVESTIEARVRRVRQEMDDHSLPDPPWSHGGGGFEA